MAEADIKELLEAGVHFGHQTGRWNPSMRPYIVGERSGIHVVDLLKTKELLEEAAKVVDEVTRRGGVVLFVGTKKQARDVVKQTAEASGMPYVNHRWLGGLLTNFRTISKRVKRLHELEALQEENKLDLLPTRERMAAEADLEKLRANLSGVSDMTSTPDLVFVIDIKAEEIAVKEARRLQIPVIGLVDTNCDPKDIDYVIPGNDDSISSCRAISGFLSEVANQGNSAFQVVEAERKKKAAEEKAKREAEEKAKREAAEKAKKEAEEKAKREAEEKAKESKDSKKTDADGKAGKTAKSSTKAKQSKPKSPKKAAAKKADSDSEKVKPESKKKDSKSADDAKSKSDSAKAKEPKAAEKSESKDEASKDEKGKKE